MADAEEKDGKSGGGEAGQPPAAPAPEARRPWTDKLVARSSLIGYILIVVAVLVVVNVVASRHDHSWDLTKNHRHSLSPESVKIVQDLHQPLDLIYFDREQQFPHARDFLGRYQRASNEVRVQYVDPDRRPELARQYNIQTYGTTAVAYQGRQQLVTTLDEQDITNAVVRVLKGGRKIVYFTAGAGERDPDDTGRNGYSEWKKALEDENFTVKSLVLAQQPAVPADCGILVVAGPTHPWVAPEVTAVSDYLKRGGRVLFLLSFEDNGPLVDYIQNTLDVQLTPDVVVDVSGVGRLFGASELMPIAATYDTHPITQQMGRLATIFPYARTVKPGNATGTGAVVEPLVETTPASFATTHFSSGVIRPDPSDVKGPLTLGVAGTMSVTTAAAKPVDARFVVYGTPDLASNAIIGFGGNRDLVLNTMNWLSAQEQFISIRPQAPENSPINLTAAQMNIIRLSVLAFLPLFIILCGIAVWWRRRAA